MIRLAVAAALGLSVASCGVFGPKGNDTGGIIPWSPENELMAQQIAQNNCSWYNKHAVLRNMNRAPGDYISYSCVFDPPPASNRRR